VLGYPIRTPSDHSSVDNSPRTIAASHVLHRLLMPRHPPCALQHFTHNKHAQTTKPDTKRCSHPLCNTQHTTTPQPTTTTTTPHTRCVRRPEPGAAPQRTTPTTTRQVSSQDPTACRNPFIASGVMFHPATPPPCRGMVIKERKTRQHPPSGLPTLTGGSLERR
jgi:hypothetical protein